MTFYKLFNLINSHSILKSQDANWTVSRGLVTVNVLGD